MKKIYPVFCLVLMFMVTCKSKKGCTDSHALNYDQSANKDDGSCIVSDYALEPKVLRDLDASFLKETSGLLNTGDRIWSFDDAGNSNDIYTIDSTNGKVKETLTLSGVSNVDYEDIAQDSQYIYVGDFGNNDGNRRNLVIYKIKKQSTWQSSNSIVPEKIQFSYPDQTDFSVNTNTDFDCEAMLVFNGNLYIFTKDHTDQQTRLYKLPVNAGTYTASLIARFDCKGLITGADISTDESKIALTGFYPPSDLAFVWILNGFSGNQFFSGKKRLINLGGRKTVGQVEGVCFINNNLLYISNEEKSSVPARLWKLDISTVQ